ncbi:cilia- and flagella-associated protein 90 [Rhea pennata]|uniref:cilia- and flagella-associated protein 90 n=1 Tax=Rhea pennata TaxID=8795 RepID=UPI002E25B103
MQSARDARDAAGGEEEEEEENPGAPVRGKHQLPLSAQSAFSYIPPGRRDLPEVSYFHQEAKTGSVYTYDSIFKRPVGYNKYLHRCDREHAKNQGLNINDEEMARPVAVLSSSDYGRRIKKPVEQLIRDHARINHVQAEFYRKNGITCLLEKPSPSLDPC